MKELPFDKDYYTSAFYLVDGSRGELRRWISELVGINKRMVGRAASRLEVGRIYDFDVNGVCKKGRIVGKNRNKYVAVFDDKSLLVDYQDLFDLPLGQNEWKRFKKEGHHPEERPK
jgi:hypothetical protein